MKTKPKRARKIVLKKEIFERPIREVRVRKEGGEFAANFRRVLAVDSTLPLNFVSFQGTILLVISANWPRSPYITTLYNIVIGHDTHKSGRVAVGVGGLTGG